MVRLKSRLVCPKCGQQGGTIGKRPVKKHVQLPSKDIIMNLEPIDHRKGNGRLVTMKLSAAFDFAAKVFLALESRFILHPPPSHEIDGDLADAVYKDLQAFDPHTELWRERFETRYADTDEHDVAKRVFQRHKNNIANDKKLMKDRLSAREKRYAETSYRGRNMDDPIEQRLREPTFEDMHISKYSSSLHYGAILFTALSHLAAKRRLPSFLLGYSESLHAFAIYSVFNRYRYDIDGRSLRTFLGWSMIMANRIRYGYNAAASLDRTGAIPLCGRCSQEINNPVMKICLDGNGQPGFYCPHCRGTEALQYHITPENIKKRECNVVSDIDLYLENAPFYEDFKQIFSACLATRQQTA